MNKEEAQLLSRLLFSAREEIDMWADVVESRHGAHPSARRLVKEIDEYRQAKGWSLHGYGYETEVPS